MPDAQRGQIIYPQSSESEAGKGLLKGHARRMAHAPQSLKLSEEFQQHIFKGKGEGGELLVVASFLTLESFDLAIIYIGQVMMFL